jgi:hypothetical protein
MEPRMNADERGWEMEPRIRTDARRRKMGRMPGKARHILAGIAWVVGSLAAWAVVCNVFAFAVFEYLGNERSVKLPAGIDTVYNWTAVAGFVLIPAIVAMLAMRSKLPWTGARSSTRRGFPIEASRALRK